MTDKEQELFYIGAAMYLNLSSVEVDDALVKAGLSPESASASECRDAIRSRFPGLYELGRRLAFEWHSL